MTTNIAVRYTVRYTNVDQDEDVVSKKHFDRILTDVSADIIGRLLAGKQ